MRLIAISLIAAVTAGCGPNLVGAGDPNKLSGAFEVCKWETIGYALDPTGVTEKLAKDKCMREFGWAPTSEKLMGWRWVGRP